MRGAIFATVLGFTTFAAAHCAAQTAPLTEAQAADLKQQVLKNVDGNAKLVQVMIDTIFSYGELGFQEFETSKYLTGLLEKNGFKVRARDIRHSDGVDGYLGIR